MREADGVHWSLFAPESRLAPLKSVVKQGAEFTSCRTRVSRIRSRSYATHLKFEAGEGWFLAWLRVEREWEKADFEALTGAMLTVCRTHSAEKQFDRWMAAGFRFVPRFVRDWTRHPIFLGQHTAEYYEAAYRRLDDLAYWFVEGESPYLDDSGFGPLS